MVLPKALTEKKKKKKKKKKMGWGGGVGGGGVVLGGEVRCNTGTQMTKAALERGKKEYFRTCIKNEKELGRGWGWPRRLRQEQRGALRKRGRPTATE